MQVLLVNLQKLKYPFLRTTMKAFKSKIPCSQSEQADPQSWMKELKDTFAYSLIRKNGDVNLSRYMVKQRISSSTFVVLFLNFHRALTEDAICISCAIGSWMLSLGLEWLYLPQKQKKGPELETSYSVVLWHQEPGPATRKSVLSFL